jgi:hypothetical protein
MFFAGKKKTAKNYKRPPRRANTTKTPIVGKLVADSVLHAICTVHDVLECELKGWR